MEFEMQTVNFRNWDLDKLEQTFGLKQIWESPLLSAWENEKLELNAFEIQTLTNLQKSLIRGGRAWNEVELENKFISPMIMTADIDDEQIGYFLERSFSAIIGDYELSGIVDGMIATGIRNPQEPYFCFHEYKRSLENQGTPDGQVLAAMLVAQTKNQQPHPIYGLFVVGLTWNFVILSGLEYCISKSYNADDEEIFTIFTMLKTLKKIIKNELTS
jgi:hypothetical protein